ncbi:hypothetical protein WG66_016720 [Moniliophthora roreri]|nr:hypothetical protein WG66_016720 [Moniliophthora roreri]
MSQSGLHFTIVPHPNTEHPNPPAASWTDLYSIYQTVSQLGATLGTMQQTQRATLQSLNAITAHMTQLWVLDKGLKGIPKFKEPNVFNSNASLVTQFLQDIRNYNSIELNNKELLNDFGKFTESFKKHFRDSNIIATAQNKLDELYQTGSAAQYIARFNEWVVYLDLTDAFKIHMLYHHLKVSIKNAISFVSKSTHPTKFKDYCEFITGINDCLHEHELEKKKDRKPKDTRVDTPESDSRIPTLHLGSQSHSYTPIHIRNYSFPFY